MVEVNNRVWIKDSRRDEKDDQANLFNMTHKRPNSGVHLKADEATEGCSTSSVRVKEAVKSNISEV